MSEISAKCLLCGSDCKKNEIKQSINELKVDCSVCGEYSILDQFSKYDKVLEGYPKNKTHLISGFVRNIHEFRT
jgi:hypothetical protein